MKAREKILVCDQLHAANSWPLICPIEDDDFRYDSQAQGAQKPQTKQPDVVVFSEVGTSTVIPKKMKSGFMVGERCTRIVEAVR